MFWDEVIRDYDNKYVWGYIDKDNFLVIPPDEFSNTLGFSEGLAYVKYKGKYGYIDKNEKVIIPFKYDFALNFKNGLAKVKLNDKWGYIDKNGTEYFDD